MSTNAAATQESIVTLTTPSPSPLPDWEVFDAAGSFTADTVKRLMED
jgi:hypothetical protein